MEEEATGMTITRRRQRVSQAGARGYDGSTLTLTSWASQAMSDDERAALCCRAVDLHCRLNVGKSSRDEQWVIRISSWDLDPETRRPASYLERRRYSGLSLAACIGRALDEYAAEAVPA